MFLLVYNVSGKDLFLQTTIFIGIIILLRYILVKSNRGFLIVFVCASLFVFINVKFLAYNELSSSLFISMALLFSQLGLAFYVIKGKYSDVILMFYLYLASFYLLLQYVKGVHPSDIIIWSENIVNFIVLSLTIAVYLSRYLKKKKIIIHPAMIGLIVGFWSTGRSGIIATLLLLFIVMIYKYSTKQKYIMMLFFGCILLFFTQPVIKKLVSLGNNIATRGGTREGLSNNIRIEIWRDYLNSIDIKSFLFGFNTNNQHIFYGFRDLHNSFLDGHYQFGIFMVLIYLLLIVACVKLILSKEYYPVLLLIIFLLRGTTDTVIFTGRFDFIFMAILLYYFIFYREMKVQRDLQLKNLQSQ